MKVAVYFLIIDQSWNHKLVLNPDSFCYASLTFHLVLSWVSFKFPMINSLFHNNGSVPWNLKMIKDCDPSDFMQEVKCFYFKLSSALL